jgi:hypothetical protein
MKRKIVLSIFLFFSLPGCLLLARAETVTLDINRTHQGIELEVHGMDEGFIKLLRSDDLATWEVLDTFTLGRRPIVNVESTDDWGGYYTAVAQKDTYIDYVRIGEANNPPDEESGLGSGTLRVRHRTL